MTNRTVQIMGYGHGASPASVTATVNGQQVFSGEVPTMNTPVPGYPIDPVVGRPSEVLFTFEIPMQFFGSLPMTVTVENSPVAFYNVNANYSNTANTTGNTVTFASSGPLGYSNILREWPGVETADPRSNVYIDGISVTISAAERENLKGTWGWTVDAGSTMSYDLTVIAGLE
jgi:hypothetical protein